MYDIKGVTAGEFLRKVTRLAKVRRQRCRFVASHGKGSHGTFYYGDRVTIVQDLNRELPPGTLHAMLRQLGLRSEDLR
jgi:predicted RNA binding protein YcfA (HicA-like mRNA interferase family)